MQTYKRQRNRYSLNHLSSETTATLPEYYARPAASTTAWRRPSPAHRASKAFSEPDGWPSDRPPDYPDSADEADEETDSVAGDGVPPPFVSAASHGPGYHIKRYSPSNISAISSPVHHPNNDDNDHQHYTLPHSHRNNRSHPHRSSYLHFQRFKTSPAHPLPSPTDDPYLDSLLERSVHALEMSNTLLQSSISTHTSFSKLLRTPVAEPSTSNSLSEEDGVDRLAEGRKGLTRRIHIHVDRPLGEAEENEWEARSQSVVSSSLPILSSMPGRRACKRRPSQIELQNSSKTCIPRLTYSPQNRSRLVAPAPRAMTQYVVASSAEAESITLPSTLGMQTQTVVKLPEPPTPAYNMLTSFVRPTPSSMPSSPSVLTSLIMRRRSNSLTPILGSGALSRISRRSGGPSTIDDPSLPPPTEESTCSSSSESLIAKQTVMSLRKILDQQAAKSDSTLGASSRRYTSRRAPAFLPVTPVPAPQVGTSNATASISRLFTKAIHTSSTRPPSPPRHSALKNGNGSRSSISAMQQQADAASTSSGNSGASSGPIYADGRTTPNPLLRINVAKAQLGMLPELVSAGVARAFGSVRAANGASTPSSGQSTPKRISFAELPEGSRPEGRSSRFKDRQAQRRRRRRFLNGRGITGAMFSAEGENDESEGGGLGGEPWQAGSSPPMGGWWPGWLSGGTGGVGSALAGMGGSSGGMYVSRYEERMEDRLNRSWNAAPGYGGLDDWAV